jgi:hypothetical protein
MRPRLHHRSVRVAGCVQGDKVGRSEGRAGSGEKRVRGRDLSAGISRSGTIKLLGFDGSHAECHQWKGVHLIGARISPEDVKKFVVQKRVQLRSGVFLLAQLDADIDANAMTMIELKLENSKALATRRPGPWRRTWDVEYFLKALEEIYVIDVVDKFADEPGGQP